MRKVMWKKGLSVAMAAAMLAGPVSVPSVFNTTAIVKAAEEATGLKDPSTLKAVNGYYYATVNMEYADFFYGELNNTAAGTDTTPDLSVDKVADYRATGMYDAVTSATSTKSTKYATSYYKTGVANDEAETKDKDGNITNTTLYGIKDVQIKIPEQLYKNLYAQKDGANKDNKIYEYLSNATFSDKAFDTEYKVLNADGTFSKMQTKEGSIVNDKAEVVQTTSTTWGDYQIDINNLNVENGPSVTTDNLYGIILTDEAGNNYGLLHSDNTWLQTQEFAWATGDVFSVHGQNHVPNGRTDGLKAGNTIKKITYLLKDSADIVINTNVKLKNLLADNVSGTADQTTWTTNGTKVKFTLNNAPSDDYVVDNVVKGARHGKTVDASKWSYDKATKTLTLDSSCVAGTDYIATFKSADNGDIKVTFAIDKANQTIDIAKDTYKSVIGSASFSLGAKANTALKYETSNDKVATVDENGKVTLKGVGTAEIKVTAETDDNYNEAVKVVKITVVKANGTLTTKAKTTVNTAVGSKSFSIGAKATTGMKVSYASSNKNVVTVTSNGTVSVKGSGIATITVTASGSNYNTTTKKITVKVAPKKQSVKAKASTKKLTVTWTKDKNATGYQVQIATKKNMKGAKTYTVTSYKTNKKVISKLKSKKTYYVRVRAYKTSGKTKLYGAYSTVKSYKVK